MAAADSSAMDRLNQARNAALSNVTLYPQVMDPILGLVAGSPSIELQIWVADFIAEALASPTITADIKQGMALKLLPTLKSFMDKNEEDVNLLKSTIQACASLYPLIFRYIITHADDTNTWQLMQAIKSSILRNMENYPVGARVCCIKFVQKVVQTQTPGIIADPRRPEQNDISLALVPREHPLIPPSNLEAETSGLLDRILGLLQDESSDLLLLTATINATGALIKSRATIATRIINAILMFNPLKVATSPLTTKVKLSIRSLERTIRALFVSILKRNPTHPLSIRMQAYMERLNEAKDALFRDETRKRPAPGVDPKALESNKKPRLDAPQPSISPLGPVSVAQIFTITTDPAAQSFDVSVIPQDIVSRLLVPLLRTIDKTRLDNAVTTVNGRLLALTQAQVDAANAVAATAPLSVEDDEEYEPDFQPMEDKDQFNNRISMESSEDLEIGIPRAAQVHLGKFSLPPPKPLTAMDLNSLNSVMYDELFSQIQFAAPISQASGPKSGLQRVAANKNDRDSLVTGMSRLLTRPTAGLFAEMNQKESDQPLSVAKVHDMSNQARQKMLQYILSDWTRRMEIAAIWLTEEWYNDQVCKKAYDEDSTNKGFFPPEPNFPRWTLLFLDELSAFIGSEHDKLLIRFVSDIPGVDASIIEKVKQLAGDPERVTMVVRVIQYLTLFRPPVREVCLDALEDLWRNYVGAKSSAGNVLKRFRPQVLEQEAH